MKKYKPFIILFLVSFLILTSIFITIDVFIAEQPIVWRTNLALASVISTYAVLGLYLIYKALGKNVI